MEILTQETFQLIKFNWRNFLFFELLYRFITFPLFLKVINGVLRFTLKMAGYSYITLGNLGYFIIKPWTILGIILISIIGLFFMIIEIGGLITGYSAAIYYQKLNPVEMLWGGVNNLVDEIRRLNWKLAGVVIANFILINFSNSALVLMQIRPINLLIKNFLEVPMARGLVVTIIVACIVLTILSLYVFQGCMIGQKKFSDSMRKSNELLKGRCFKSLLLLTGYNIALALGSLLLYFLCLVFVTIWVVFFVDHRMELAFLISFKERMQIWFLFLSSIGSGLIYYCATTVQYYQYQNGLNREPRRDLIYSRSSILAKKNLLKVILVVSSISIFCLFDTLYNGNHFGMFVAVDTGITAHRGSSQVAPENTMPALATAVLELADFAEIDVQETKDGVVVLFHDNTLRRVAGINRSIASMTWEELSKVDVGKWFSSEYEGTLIPSLEEVMEYSKGKIKLNIEIKNVGKNTLLPEKVLAYINQYDMGNQCVITSTNLQYLRRIKELQPDIKTGYILSAAYGNYYSDEAIDFISIRSGFVSEKLVDALHESGKTIHVWTVNSKIEMERLKMLGVDNIITDVPVVAREVLYNEEATANLLEYLRVLLR